MCNGKDAERLIREAKEIEQNHPKEARQKYLEAAEIMLYLSIQDKVNEQRYTQFANELYNKAKYLDPNDPLESGKGHHEHNHDHNTKALHKEVQQNQTDNFDATQYISDTKLSFKDIGGLEDLKEEIRFKIIEPLKHPELFAYYGKKMGGGILMYGPPGCGKTLIAEATANECNATFFHVKSSDLKSKYVGETEKNIAELFEKARAMQPSIIFFDEFEALGNDRTASAHAHEVSTVAQLLTEMDGMGTKDQKILLLAATNEPWSIDPALRREGRFGDTLFIPPPDEESRRSILQIHMKDRPMEKMNWEELAKLTEHFSGADIKGVCESATDIPLKEYFKTKKQRAITMNDFQIAKEKTNSIVIPWFKKAEKVVKERKMSESFMSMINFVAKLPVEM